MKKSVILCVDDESIVLRSLKAELREAFPELMIETAEGGEQALELFDELTEDNIETALVISDYIMPDMKGDELLCKIHEKSPKPLKIMLTGQATPEGIGNAINKAKLYRYIPKPWDNNDFILTVKEAIRSFFQDKRLEEQNEELRILNNHLEEKVKERTAEIEAQKGIIELKNRNITDSIKYALRIQQAILPSELKVSKLIPESFILYMPKDIVSGDFYWLEECNGKTLFAAIDCTGHGVPGAFMSLLGYNGLTQAVRENNLDNPAEILNFLSNYIRKMLRQDKEHDMVCDGMDLCLCVYDKNNLVLEYAGVHNTCYLVRNNEVHFLRAETQPIGECMSDEFNGYTSTQIPVQSGDLVYLFTDGFIDQFGGLKRKKYMSKRFREFLLSITSLSLPEQKKRLSDEFAAWKGNIEQYDDVLVMGVKI